VEVASSTASIIQRQSKKWSSVYMVSNIKYEWNFDLNQRGFKDEYNYCAVIIEKKDSIKAFWHCQIKDNEDYWKSS
jgi:hypothetical protein